MRTLIALLFFFVYSVNSLPPKGCTSCLMVPVERHPHSGSFEVQKVIDGKGCFLSQYGLIYWRPYLMGFNGSPKQLTERNAIIIPGEAQTLKCRGNKQNADTFVQFNQGSSGFLAHGDQEVKLKCANDGRWQFVHSGWESIIVESMACLST